MLIQIFLFFGFALAENLGPVENFFRVDEIRVKGIKKVEKEAILEKINAQVGKRIDNYSLKKDLEKIYSLKYFASVEAHHEIKKGKNILVFVVKERPIIGKIVFSGNSEMDRDELLEQMKTKEYSILDVNTVKNDVRSLKKFYEEKGYYLISIDHSIKKRREETVEVVFNIKEYDKVRVKKIIFLGNKAFNDKELKGIMETREESLFSSLTGSGNFKEFNFQTDVERVKLFYKSKGYLQINVSSPEITVSEDKKWVFITLRLAEGPQFSINNITFINDTLFSDEEFRKKIASRDGDIYSELKIQQDIQMLTEMYQDKGYAFANVLRTLEVVPGEHKVNVRFSFERGKIVYFGKIRIKGNSKTRDKVIRRELRIREGAMFSGSALRKSKENVNRLGFFEPNSVIFKTITRKGSDDVFDVEISVKERNTGQISMGAGYSSTTGMFFQGSIAQNNFRGKGQSLSFSTTWSGRSKDMAISFTEPYAFDTKWTAGGDIFFTNSDLSSAYSLKKSGFALRLGYPIFEYVRVLATYKFENTSIRSINDPTIDTELENGISSSIRSAIIMDKRNNKFEPTKGLYMSFATEYSGLGGSKKWWRNEAEGRYYMPVIGDWVFKSRLYAGKLFRVDGQRIPRSAKFFLGGPRNLRGYNYQAVGPHNEVQVNGRTFRFNVGSLFSTFTQLEMEHPLAKEAGLKWAVFFDAGGAGDTDSLKIKANYGLGLRWFAPIGILRFGVGFPINPDSGMGSGGEPFFDFGQLF
ncbi:MAG: outer membrane protein assembly factor BamA [Halobacteriovoraceae bacterium]|nr:outer membrane protein assembly factor BamA [Halobacteriovoraceae bacterium]